MKLTEIKFGFLRAHFITDLDKKNEASIVQQFDDNTNLVVLLIKFPISLITHSNLTNDSSVVISTNRGTKGPYIKLHGDSYSGIKYAGVMLKQHSIDSSTAILVERKM